MKLNSVKVLWLQFLNIRFSVSDRFKNESKVVILFFVLQRRIVSSNFRKLFLLDLKLKNKKWSNSTQKFISDGN